MRDREVEAAAIDASAGGLASPVDEVEATLEACPLAVVNIDPEGRVTYWSSGAEDLFGWKAEEVLGRVLPTVPDERLSEFDFVHARQRRGEAFDGYRTKRRRKDGSVVNVTVWSKSRFAADGTFAGTVSFVAPVEHGVLVDTLAGARHAEFQALLDASPLAVIAIDAEGTVTAWNAEAELLFGWSAGEVIGGPLPHIPSQLREEYEQIRARQVAGEVLRGVETRRRCKDGSEVEVAIWSASRLDANGRFLGTIAFVADVSERKQAERRDRAAHERGEALRGVSGKLASAATTQHVVEVLVHEGANALDAPAGWAVLVDADTEAVRTVAAHGLAMRTLSTLEPMPLGTRTPETEAFRTRKPVWIDSADDYRERYPEAVARPPELESCAVYPLLASDRALGAVSFHFRDPGPIPGERRLLLSSLVAECERACERALLYEEVRSTEHRLREANLLLTAVTTGMEDILCVKDRAGRYLLANDAAARPLGLPDGAAIVGRTDHELQPLEVDAIVAADRAVLDTGEPLVFEETLEMPTGLRTFITAKSPLRDAENEIVGVIVVSKDITQRKLAEDRLAQLHAVTAAVAQAEDSFEVGSVIVDAARAAFGADGGGLAVADEGSDTLQVIAFTGVPDEVVDTWRTFSSSLHLPFNEVIRTGRPVILTSREDVSRYPDLVERYRQTGMSVGAYVPIQAGGRRLGALSVTFATPRGFGEDDLAFLTTLGSEGAAALERARLYEHERDIAETLQRRLLPERLPSIAGLPLAARYVAGGQGLDVGGDWYDAMELPDGWLALIVGDVVGHGIDAAATMGQLRSSLRFALLDHDQPRDALASVNRLVHVTRAGELATVACAIVDPARHEVRHFSAGHPPPLVISPAGEPSYLEGGRSLPLGVRASTQFREETAPFESGSTLLLYTDGLIERRGEHIEAGLERLRSVALLEAEADLESLLGLLVEQLVGPSPSDDVAVLGLRTELVSADTLVLELPADPVALGRLRHRLGHWLDEKGASQEDSFAITVATSEAAANAIEHAYGLGDETFRVEATLVENEIRILVRDSGTWRGSRHVDRGRGLALMEALMDEVDLATEELGTEVRLARKLLRDPS